MWLSLVRRSPRASDVPFINGDALHTRSSACKPSSDQQYRLDWLNRVCAHAVEAVTELGHEAAVASCWSPTRACRDAIRQSLAAHGVRAIFVSLETAKSSTGQATASCAGSEDIAWDEVDVVRVGDEAGCAGEAAWLVGHLTTSQEAKK